MRTVIPRLDCENLSSADFKSKPSNKQGAKKKDSEWPFAFLGCKRSFD
jgi:hypothetical protein